MSTRHTRLLMVVAVLMMGQPARAEIAFDLLVSSMEEALECFDSAVCQPDPAMVWLTNLATGARHDVPLVFQGISGQPSAYRFVTAGDAIVGPGANQVDSLAIMFRGPQFRHETRCRFESPELLFFTVGPPDPSCRVLTIPPGSGCPCDGGLIWPVYDCGNPVIYVDQDYTVPAGETLTLPAGHRIRISAGSTLRIEGQLVGHGQPESWIVLHGEDWNGIDFVSGSSADLSYTRIRGASAQVDGGALRLAHSSEAALDHCIIDHCTSLGRGGGVFVADGALLRMRSCTVSHNSAASGGNLFVEGSGHAMGNYNLVTFGSPQTMATDSGAVYGNLQASCLYPLDDPSQGTGWYCDPGYADAAHGDFTLSFWNPAEPDMRNCVIDVAVIDGDLDPDGTPSDMGARPFNQFDVLQPARILDVYDRPGDQGSSVILDFAASPNDGSVINPVSFYSVWIRYPGTAEFISSGQAVGALGLGTYSLAVPTFPDSTSFNGGNPEEFLHHYRVFTHTGLNPALAIGSPSMAGYSIDNLQPDPVSGLESDPQWTCLPDQELMWLDLQWQPVPDEDLLHYRIQGGWSPDPDDAVVLGESSGTRYRVTIPLPESTTGEYTAHVLAVDRAGNVSTTASLPTPLSDCGLTEVGTPDAFALLSAHPNPFNPSTRVSFALQHRGRVTLNLFNLGGERVRALLDETLGAGQHVALLDGSGLATGMYILRLETPMGGQTRKVLLLK